MCSADTYEVCHVATYLPAYQISGSQPASYAVDSDRRTDWPLCSLTNYEMNPWWVVDLGVPLTVTGVYFTNVNHSGESTSLEHTDNYCLVRFTSSDPYAEQRRRWGSSLGMVGFRELFVPYYNKACHSLCSHWATPGVDRSFFQLGLSMGTRIGLLKIPELNLVLCLVLYTCIAFYCISAVLRDRCWFCCSVLTATVMNEHYYYYVI